MYTAFYELQREPFHVTPDPDFLFPSPAHKEALAAIIYGIEQRKGFVAITGEVGVGKTTILRSYLDFADRQNLKLIYVYNSNLTFDELVTMLLQELGVTERPPSTFQAVSRLHEALIDVYRKNQTVVLIVDEAQNMPVDTLESLRMLSNLETVTEKLIQIMLIGQPEFDELLQQHRLRQLRQRIAIHARLGPLNFEDSVAYLEHRLAKVATGTKPVFTKNALRLIAEASQGIPRNLNILSDNALITGYGYQQRPVTARVVREVLADRGFAAPAPEPSGERGRGVWIGTGMAAVAAVAVIVGVLALRPELMPGESRRTTERQPPAAIQPTPAPEPRVASRSPDAGNGAPREPVVSAPAAPVERQPPAATSDAAKPPPAPPAAPRPAPAPPPQTAERPQPAPPQAALSLPPPPTPRPTEIARSEPAKPPERAAVTVPPANLRPQTPAPTPAPAATPPPAPSPPRPTDVARAQPTPPREAPAGPPMPAPTANAPTPRPSPAPPPATANAPPARPAPAAPPPAEPPRSTRSGATDTATVEARPAPPPATARRTQAPIPLAAPPPRPAPSIAAVPAPAAPAVPPSVMLPSASGSGVTAQPSADSAEALIARPLATLPPPASQTVRAVRAGDTLWTMAEEVYGFVSPSVLRRVQDANPQIRNINVLAPGQEVVFPRVQESPLGRGPALSESVTATGRN